MTADTLTVQPVPSSGPIEASETRAPRTPERTDPAARSLVVERPREAGGTTSNEVAELAARAHEEAQKRLTEALDEARSKGYLRELNLQYEFTESGSMVIKVMDARTDKLVRTIPSEEQLAFARGMERFLGLLFDRRG